MFLRNLKSGWRNIMKNKLFSVINILGLSIGFAVSMLILFWVVDELSFDKFHENIDNIYTIYEHQQYSDGQELFTPCTPFPLGKSLVADFEEVEMATTFTIMGNMPFEYDNNQYIEGPVMSADADFLRMFTFELISGSLDCLNQPDKVVITPEIAKLYFGDENPLGKILTLSSQYPLEVGAVVEQPSKNSTYSFKIIIPILFMQRNEWADIESWDGNWPRTSVLLKPQINTDLLANKIVDICKTHGQESTSLHLFSFKKEHLYNYSGQHNHIQYIYQFMAIAFIIILIASINFVNFSTAHSEQRKPEIGIRKSLGASRFSLVGLFFHEKGLTVVFSIMLSILMVVFMLPFFNQYVHKTIGFAIVKDKYLLMMLMGVFITTIGLSIAYPALYMSSFAPVKALKKQAKTGAKHWGFKNALIIVQFSLSIGLIICSIFISVQLKYVSNFDLGYNKENLIYLELNGASTKKHEVLQKEFEKISGIVSQTRCGTLPFWGGSSSWGFQWEGKHQEKDILFSHIDVDRNYFETLGIELSDGQTFSRKYDQVDSDRSNDEIVLNAEAIRLMGIDNPVGKKFWHGGSDSKSEIVGVTQDYHFQSLKNKIEPLIIRPLSGDPRHFVLRVNAKDFSATLSEIKATWKEVCTDTEYAMGFFDQRIEQLYNADRKIAGLFKTFTLIAIFISCIGLFGLSLYAIEIRRKEIGIRKVNGSSRFEIISLINKEFVTRIVIAFVIASPLSFFIMSKWLESFAYKTPLSWWVFLLSGCIALLVAIVTVSWQSWTAASRNPVESLRYE